VIGKIQHTADPAMRILLQHARTGLYLRSPRNWSSNPYEATDFQHSQRAIDFARSHQLTGVQIAVSFLDNEYDDLAPLTAVAQTGAQLAYR